MKLSDIDVKSEYRSLLDNMVNDFYVPLLSCAKTYNRAVGFFSSTALIEISKGLSAFAKNGGKIKLIASPYLSDEDIKAMRVGYEQRDNVIKNAIRREMTESETVTENARLNLLANLIADGVLDIKIAFTEEVGRLGMYHEKMGIIADDYGNKVAFSGSMNESLTAMTINYEAIDVFCSWKNEENRVRLKENAFNSIWNNEEPNVRIIDFPELKQEIIDKYKHSPPDYNIDKKDLDNNQNLLDNSFDLGNILNTKVKNIPEIPDNVHFYDYQQTAIEQWKKQNYCGIFDMATGTGKTFTGLGALVELSKDINNKFAAIIVCPFQHLVEQWVEDIEKFNICPIIGYSSSNQRDWKDRLKNSIRDQKLKVKNKEFFCFICTNATFRSEYVQSQISRINSDILLMVDEAHNFGAPYLSCLLNNQYKYRLALSATINRHRDTEGTQKLFDFFGDKCIEYTLDRAIEEKKLTPYKYYPIIVTLTADELDAYNHITYEMGKCLMKSKSGKTQLNEKGKMLALKRARIVAGAEGKIEALEEHIKPYLYDSHILVYCGATTGLEKDMEFTDVDDEDIRQIDAVTDLLGNKLDMDVSQFTSKEDIEEREILKREFSQGDTLKVLIAIKCLDEGVNIPKIKTAFILASTTNPKEYIQRRGRVLRLSKGKEFAEIYDFITLPYSIDNVSALTKQQLNNNITLVKNELSRAMEFSRIAMNTIKSSSIIDDIKDAYGLYNYDGKFEEDIIDG